MLLIDAMTDWHFYGWIHEFDPSSTHTWAQYHTFGAKKNYRGVLGEETDIDVGTRNIKSSRL